jgi:uncharacterized protein (TIGR00730 family)
VKLRPTAGCAPGTITNVPAVTVFGGSRIGPGSDEYAAALQLGRALAERGLSVVTGGYSGTMEAVSRGAKEAGGQTIGITVEILARTALPNAWLDQEVRTAALLERIDKMVELGDAYVVLPGGAGTLVELGVVWNLAILGALHGKPIVVVGDGWRQVLATLVEHLHTVEADLRWLTFVPDAQAAAEALAAALATPPEGRALPGRAGRPEEDQPRSTAGGYTPAG